MKNKSKKTFLLQKNIKNINSILCTYGIDIRKLFSLPKVLIKYIKDIKKFKSMGGKINFLWPIYFEDNGKCTSLSDYSILSFLVIKDIFERGKLKHFDIGSSVEMFIMPLSAAGIKVTLLDIRETNFLDAFEIKNKVFDACSSNNKNAEILKKENIYSLSCIHAIEHFGLGRYQDDIDPFAQKKFISNAADLLLKGSIFYLGMPIGDNEVFYNAHRLMSINYYKKLVFKYFYIESIFLVDPNSKNKFIKLKPSEYNNESQTSNYIAALFVLVKK